MKRFYSHNPSTDLRPGMGIFSNQSGSWTVWEKFRLYIKVSIWNNMQTFWQYIWFQSILKNFFGFKTKLEQYLCVLDSY